MAFIDVASGVTTWSPLPPVALQKATSPRSSRRLRTSRAESTRSSNATSSPGTCGHAGGGQPGDAALLQRIERDFFRTRDLVVNLGSRNAGGRRSLANYSCNFVTNEGEGKVDRHRRARSSCKVRPLPRLGPAFTERRVRAPISRNLLTWRWSQRRGIHDHVVTAGTLAAISVPRKLPYALA
jgi:hypothetical protein